MNKIFIYFLFLSSVSANNYNKYNKIYKLEYKGDYWKTHPKKEDEEIENDGDIPLPKGNKGYYKIGKPYTILGQKYYPSVNENYEESGMASWYGDGDGFHGGKTANGETYNMNDLTAAHRTLPLPSIVKITNLESGKSIIVRINDRGPFAKNRIIDVSRKVAKILEFHNKGTTKVRVKYLKKETDEMLRKLGFK
jgi:rare lipoprotein A (peptidoglycan hydrolase)